MVFHYNLSILKEGKMISSPCANCNKKNQPKEACAKECEILQAIQLYHVSIEKKFIVPAIDYSEEGRFYLNTRDII